MNQRSTCNKMHFRDVKRQMLQVGLPDLCSVSKSQARSDGLMRPNRAMIVSINNFQCTQTGLSVISGHATPMMT